MAMDGYQDCYAQFDGTVLCIGTGRIEHRVVWRDGRLWAESVLDRHSGYRWANPGRPVALCNVRGVTAGPADPEVRTWVDDLGGLAQP